MVAVVTPVRFDSSPTASVAPSGEGIPDELGDSVISLFPELVMRTEVELWKPMRGCGRSSYKGVSLLVRNRALG